MIRIHRIYFNDLPDMVRDKLVSAIRIKTDGSPSEKHPYLAPPILAEPEKPLLKAFILTIVWVIIIGITIYFAQKTLGDEFQPYGTIIGYGFSILFMIGLPLIVLHDLWTWKALPFKSGIYLFPLHLVDAREPVLKIIPLLSETQFNFSYNRAHKICLHFANGHIYAFSTPFFLRSSKRVAWAKKQLTVFSAIRPALFEAIDKKESFLSDKDPFYSDTTFSYAPSPSGVARFKRLTPDATPPFFTDAAKIWRLALILALLLGPAVWGLRNYASDQSMLENARQADSSAAYREYLAKGWHKKVVLETLLPNATFKEAVQKQSVTMLRNFIFEFPHHPEVPAARRLIKSYFSQVRVHMDTLSNAETGMNQFINALIGYLDEKQTNELKVYISPPDIDELKKIDRFLSEGEKLKEKLHEKWKHEGEKDYFSSGRNLLSQEMFNTFINQKLASIGIQLATLIGAAPVTQNFSPDKLEKRKDILIASLNAGFNALVPHEIMKLVKTTKKNSIHSEPIILINYKAEPSHAIYAGKGEITKKYIGLKFQFNVSAIAPGMSSPYCFEVTANPPKSFDVQYFRRQNTPLMFDQPADSLIYDTMIRRAFENLQKTFSKKLGIESL